MDNVWSELGIDWINPRITKHLVWSFSNLFREILIFNYLIITRDNIYVSKRRKKNNIKLDKLVVEKFPVVANFHDVIKSCHYCE